MNESQTIAIMPQTSRRPRVLIACFAVLAILTICNLNAIGQQIIGIPQLFSPLILLASIVGWVACRGSLFKVAKTPIWPFCLALGFFMLLGIASGQGERGLNLLPTSLSITASLIILIAVTCITLKLVSLGQTNLLLTICFVASLIATLSVFIPVVYPDWQVIMESKDDQRASGFFANPNEAGVAIMYFVAFAFALSSRTNQPVWLIIALPVAAVAVFFTYSRSSLLGVFVLIFVLSLFVFPIRRVLVSGGIIVLGLMLMLLMRTYIDDASRNEEDFSSAQIKRLQLFNDLLSGRIDKETTGGRSELAEWTINEWSKSPWIGHGLSSFSGGKDRLGSHNTYLMVLGETGVIGFIPFVFAWFVLFRSVSIQRDRWVLVLGIGILCSISLVALASHNTFERRDGIFIMAVCFAIISGLAKRRYVLIQQPAIPTSAANVETAQQTSSVPT